MNVKSGRVAVDPIRKEDVCRARSGVWNQPWSFFLKGPEQQTEQR